jgi:hypothetical protein
MYKGFVKIQEESIFALLLWGLWRGSIGFHICWLFVWIDKIAKLRFVADMLDNGCRAISIKALHMIGKQSKVFGLFLDAALIRIIHLHEAILEFVGLGYEETFLLGVSQFMVSLL